MSGLIAILGPTASGKTDLAIDVAERLGAEILSVDSMQVYRGMDIGTAKPTPLQRRGIPHHMIDIVEPEEEFTVAEFRRQARSLIKETDAPMVVTGGSGLHFRAVVDPMGFAPTDTEVRKVIEGRPLGDLVAALEKVDPSAGLHIDLANRRRVVRAVEILELTGETPSQRAASAEAEDLRRYVAETPFLGIGVDPGDALDHRIEQRLESMREGGLLEEVRGLRGRLGRNARNAVGYRELVSYMDGEVAIDQAWEDIRINTRRLARRQRTWFQRDPRIRWIPWLEDPEDRLARVMELIG